MADAGQDRARSPFEALANSAPDVIVTIDATGIVLSVNAAVTPILGYAPAELLGGPLTRIIPERFRERHYASFSRYVASGRRTIPWSGVPLAALTRDGRELPVEISFGEFVDADGRRVFSGFIRDASERHEHVRRLREAIAVQQRQAELLGAVEQALITTDLSGNVLTWNEYASTLYGWSADEAVGRNLNDLLRPDPEQESQDPDRSAVQRLRSGERVRYERVVKRRDGEHIWVSVVAAPIRDETGRLSRLIGTSSDVTERRQLEAQLRQVQKMDAVGRLAAGVAHDFNNLLTVVSGHAELLLLDAEEDDRPDHADHAREIVQAATRGAALTRQLLAFSRPDAGTIVPVQLNHVLTDLKRMLERLVEARVSIEYDLADDVPAVLGDATQIQQVAVNLVVNARDAMPGGGTIRILTRRAMHGPGPAGGTFATLCVEDHGVGMSPDVLSRIFEPFFTTKATGKGTGLGLATVYGIVKQMGGSVDVQSSPGKGSMFTAFFPAAHRARARDASLLAG